MLKATKMFAGVVRIKLASLYARQELKHETELLSKNLCFTWDNLGGDASRVLDLVTIVGSSVQ